MRCRGVAGALLLAAVVAGCSDAPQGGEAENVRPVKPDVSTNAAAPAAVRPAPEPDFAGAPISIERRTAERVFNLKAGGVDRRIVFKVDLEYPSSYGISREEHARMTSFIDGMLFDSADFAALVESAARKCLDELAVAASRPDFEWNVRPALTGRMTYADDRYFSYNLDFICVSANYQNLTYDRRLGRRLLTADLIAAENHPQLRQAIREFVRFVLPEEMAKAFLEEQPADWPAIKECPSVGREGVEWQYGCQEFGLGSWVKAYVGWDRLATMLRDPGLRSRGTFRSCALPPVTADAPDWWRFPYRKIKARETTPPNPPFAGTNYPYASVELDLDIPMQGGMTAEKYAALQNFLGGVLTHGRRPHASVQQGLDRMRVEFWDKAIRERRNTGPDDDSGGFDVLEVRASIPYRDDRYVCFRSEHERGCPCCCVETNAVWSWAQRRPLAIEDVISPVHAPELKKLMRAEVCRKLALECDDPEFQLPDYAADWPHTFANFRLDERGVTWCYDAGEVVSGGKGSDDTKLAWEQLKPLLNPSFELPGSPQKTAVPAVP